MENIERFDQLCGELFAEMYACFPNFVDTRETFSEWVEGDTETKTFLTHTLNWLESNGLIETRGETLANGAALIRPTMKGMAMLKMTPASLEARKSVGDILLDAIKSGSKSALASIVHEHFMALYVSLSGVR